MNVSIRKIDPVFVACVRHVGPYHACDPAWKRLCEIVYPAGLVAPDAIAYGVCYDDPAVTPAEECRMDVCISLPKGMDANDPKLARILKTTELATMRLGGAGEYACLPVKGPYSLLAQAYAWLFGEWLPQSGRECVCSGDNPGFEAYYNDPDKTAPEELLSEIFVPLKARS